MDCVASLSHALEPRKLVVVGANNGSAALAYLETGLLPSLILLDLSMPSMDGWEFLERYRQEPRLAGVPIILVSAEPTLRDTAIDIKVAGYLKKPFSLDALMAVIDTHVPEG